MGLKDDSATVLSLYSSTSSEERGVAADGVSKIHTPDRRARVLYKAAAERQRDLYTKL